MFLFLAPFALKAWGLTPCSYLGTLEDVNLATQHPTDGRICGVVCAFNIRQILARVVNVPPLLSGEAFKAYAVREYQLHPNGMSHAETVSLIRSELHKDGIRAHVTGRFVGPDPEIPGVRRVAHLDPNDLLSSRFGMVGVRFHRDGKILGHYLVYEVINGALYLSDPGNPYQVFRAYIDDFNGRFFTLQMPSYWRYDANVHSIIEISL